MMKFTDLDFDCLENVLEYLELMDLLSVADSTRRLRKAAHLVYAQKYSNKTVSFGVIRICPEQPFQFTKKCIECKDLKTSLQLLRCVGPAISKIVLNPVPIQETDQSQNDRWLFTYINEYCAENLKEITLQRHVDSSRYYRRPILDYFNKQFTNLVRVSHADYNFTHSIKKLFPKLQKLTCAHFTSSRNASFYEFNTNYFPNLKTLNIDEFVHKSSSVLSNDTLLPLLKKNPQLKELRITTNFYNSNLNTKLIWMCIESLQNLKNLTLSIKPIPFKVSSDNVKHIKSVKVFEIEFWMLKKLPTCFFPFSFEQLEKFTVFFPMEEFHSFFVDEFFNFVEKHSKIKHLTIRNILRSESMDWTKLAQYLPELVRIELTHCWFSIDEALIFVDLFQMLNKIRFRLSDDYETFFIRLDGKWKGKYESEENFVELKRIQVK